MALRIKFERSKLTCLGQTGREQHTLEQFAHSLEKLVDERPLEHVHLMRHAVDLDWHHKVGVVHLLQGQRETGKKLTSKAED